MPTGNGGISQVDIVKNTRDGITPSYQGFFFREIEDPLLTLMPFYDQPDHSASSALWACDTLLAMAPLILPFLFLPGESLILYFDPNVN